MHNLIDDIRFADVRSKMHDALLDYMAKFAIRSACHQPRRGVRRGWLDGVADRQALAIRGSGTR